MIKLATLIENIEGAVINGDAATEIKFVEYDSRNVRPGCLFVAVQGYQQDGYDFVSDAINNGAVAVLGEKKTCPDAPVYVSVPDVRQALAEVSARLYDYPGRGLKVCGVTGTNGKSTTCHLIQNILKSRQKITGLISSVVYDTAGESFKAERTTPESLDVQRLLYLMRKNHCVNAVIEVSSHALMLHRVDHVNFRVGVFTNITRDHLDFHKTMDEYLEAKKRLLEHLEGDLSYAVINLDVPEFRSFFGDLKSAYMSYSLSDSAADVYLANYEINIDHTLMDLVTPMGTETVRFPLPGRFNLMNALAAATAGLASGVDIANVVKGLESASQVPGRFEAIKAGQPFGIYLDFAHTPDALARLCETARELTDGRLLLLFGCGGDRDKGKRPQMGEAATAGADFCVVTSDNPRGEEPEAIINDIKPGLSRNQYEIIPDRASAMEAILSQATDGDVVLLAGKGAEDYQEIKGQRLDYNDKQVALDVLAKMGFTTTDGEQAEES